MFKGRTELRAQPGSAFFRVYAVFGNCSPCKFSQSYFFEKRCQLVPTQNRAVKIALYRSVACRLPGLLRTNSRLSILSLWCPHLCNRGFRSVPRLRVPILMPSRIFGSWEQKQVRSRFHCSNLIPDGITTTGGWSGLILFSMRWLQSLQ